MRLISNQPVQAHLSILDFITLVLLTLTLKNRLVCISLCPRQHVLSVLSIFNDGGQ